MVREAAISAILKGLSGRATQKRPLFCGFPYLHHLILAEKNKVLVSGWNGSGYIGRIRIFLGSNPDYFSVESGFFVRIRILLGRIRIFLGLKIDFFWVVSGFFGSKPDFFG